MSKFLFLAVTLALVFVLWAKPEVRSNSEAEEQIRSVAAAPSPKSASLDPGQKAERLDLGQKAGRLDSSAASSVTEGTEAAASDEALPAVAPARMFPNARIIAQVETAGEKNGEVKLIKTVETNRKEKFIRIEETYAGGVASANLVRETAMVANQLLTQKPEAMGEDSFLRILGEVGAADVHKIGEAFLVTFRAEPENPRALDGYIAKLKAALGASVVEPNYLRHLM